MAVYIYLEFVLIYVRFMRLISTFLVRRWLAGMDIFRTFREYPVEWKFIKNPYYVIYSLIYIYYELCLRNTICYILCCRFRVFLSFSRSQVFFLKIQKMHKQPTGYAGPISGNRTCLRKQTQQTSLGFQDLFTAFITDYNSLCSQNL